MQLQILTSKSSWLFNNKKKFLNNLKKIKKIKKIEFLNKSQDISNKANIIFVLSYYKIIPLKFLNRNKHIYVIHDSDLPRGRGMSPLFNQILKGKKNIVSTIFRCGKNLDNGKIVFKKKFFYPDNFIYDEIKNSQMQNNIIIIKKFITLFTKRKIKFKSQKGKATYYKKISEKKNNIDKSKSIISQFDKIRTRDNKFFRAFFVHKKRKYFIKIEPENSA